MKRNILIILATIAFVLPSLALNNETPNTLPETSFRSTSAMSGAGSAYSSMPALNADGTAALVSDSYSPAKSSGGPRRIGPTANETPDEEDLVPVGDGLWILMLLAVGYAGVITWKRRIVKR